MAMAASKIVAEPLTITGSIGVVTGKFNLEELYRRVQYSKVVISKGRSACCLFSVSGLESRDQNLAFPVAAASHTNVCSISMHAE